MASKKILLEVLSPNGSRGSSPPPRPKREERRRERPARAFRPVPIPVPSTQALLLVLAGVVGVVTAYFFGYWRGSARGGASPEIQTKAADPLAEVADEPPPAKPVEGSAGPPAAARSAGKFGVQLVSYEDTPANRELALKAKAELTGTLPDVGAWVIDSRKAIFLTAGAFDSKKDPELLTLRDRIRNMPFGKEKAPFATAEIREIP